jgi:HEAT repeat protein
MSLTATGLEAALQSTDQSLRLRAAMMAGTYPSTEFIEVLVVQCAIESEFLVRDMLTWALIRNDPKLVVERLKPELNSEVAQARSQALHTLTKIGDTTTYPLVSGNLLFDADDRVAMTAWRAASLLVPERSIPALIPALLTQLGRGEFEIQFALSRALCSLGEEVLEPLAQRSKSATPEVAEHLAFTLRLLKNPYSESRLARDFAEKLKILKGAPAIGESTT